MKRLDRRVGASIVFLMFLGIVVQLCISLKKQKEKTRQVKILSDKHFAMFSLMNQWVRIKQQKKHISSYLIERGYTKVAVYGMSFIGNTLVEELKNTDVYVLYGIDQSENIAYTDTKVISKEDLDDSIDAIIVSAFTSFDQIKIDLSAFTNVPILSIEDILYDI